MQHQTKRGHLYPEDTASKRLTRFLFWSKVKEQMSQSAWSEGPHLVLAGPWGGDVTILRALGVPPKSIIMVDVNEDALKSAQSVHSDVKAIHGDVLDVVTTEFQNSLRSAYLDFCSTACKGSISTAVAVYKAGITRRGGYFGTTFYSSRENDKRILRLIEAAKRKYGDDPAIARAHAVRDAFQAEYRKNSTAARVPSPTHAWYYQNEETNKPLMVMLWRQGIVKKSIPISSVVPSTVDAQELAKHIGWEGTGYLLCLSKGTIAAYKSHATRLANNKASQTTKQ